MVDNDPIPAVFPALSIPRLNFCPLEVAYIGLWNVDLIRLFPPSTLSSVQLSIHSLQTGKPQNTSQHLNWFNKIMCAAQVAC